MTPFPARQTEYTKVDLEPRDNFLIISLVAAWRRKMGAENYPLDLASVPQPNKHFPEEMLSCMFVSQAGLTFQHSGQLLSPS